jgi:hypothetical protein
MEKAKNVLLSFPKPRDPLGEMFKLQKEFGSKFCHFDRSDPNYKNEWLHVFSDCVYMEAAELLDWLPWKHWKNYKDFVYNIDEIRFEIIDMLHFAISLMLLDGKSVNSFFRGIMCHEPLSDNYEAFDKTLIILKGHSLVRYMISPCNNEGKYQLTVWVLRGLREHSGLIENMFKDVLTLCAIWDMDAQLVYDYYKSKNKENHDRQARGY